MNYSMKNSQQSLMNFFHLPNNSQYMQGNNQNLKYLLKNFKINNIISHNNCCISKFKTTKNSPERLIFEKATNIQKNIDNKKDNKYPIRGKILLGNQKKPDKIVEELLRNKINKNKQKINNKMNDNKNNSMNKGTIYRNINANTNNNHTNIINDNLNINLNNISHILPNKNNNGPNKSIIGFDFTNQISGPTLAGPNSYRAPQKKTNNMLEDEEYFIYINKNNKNINKNINKKNNNINDKKFSSFSTNKQRKNMKNNGVNFNTIIAKKNYYGQNKNNLNNLNSNFINKGANNIINNTKNNNNNNSNAQKSNSIFSSTMSSLSKPRPQKQINKNSHFDIKSKTSYPTKNNSRKQSNEKTRHGDNKTTNNSKNKYKNYSNINHMRVYSDKNKYMNKNKPTNISQNNSNNNDNNNYKISATNNNMGKKYLYNSNIVQIIPNGLNVSQYKLSNINSANNSKEYSRDNSSQQNKMSSNIIDLKKSSVEKLLSQLHKNKDNSYNNLSRDEHDLKEKISNIMNKNIYSNLNNINYRDLKKSSKIIVNKNSNPIIIKDEKISSEKNSKIDLKEKEKNIISLKDQIKEPIKDKAKQKLKEKEKENNEHGIIIKEKSKEKSDKIIPDKDLSDSENDSLLLYVNNNIENNLYQDSALNESSCSLLSTLKENGKFSCYNRDMEIISNYIKNYYNKYKKYPKTKMNFYKYGRLLGKGAFGKVNLSLHVLTGRLVAIKSINKSKLMNEKQRRKIMLETSIMKTLSKSNNIVKIFETYETKKHYCIVMEYICAGDLLSYIKKRGKLTEQVAKFIFKQIVLSLQYIHSHNIVHRDIKLDNILIDLDNNIKICDFGVSKIVKKGEPMMEQCGTPAYIAPEILLNKGYEGFGVDIWSAGVVLYAMLGGTVPFKGNNIDELHDLIIKGEFKPLKDISPDATHLIRSILEVDPKKRIGTKDILVHPWLINVDLNFWKTQNLFTNAEYILLAKSNVDYRDISNKDDMIEIFDIKNLDTNDENRNKNVKTKSFILAPFNSSMEEDNDGVNANINESLDFYDSDLQIQNGLIKFNNKVKDLNRNYELNNNKEIDNGVVISPHNSDEKNKKENNDISPNNGSFNNNNNSKGISKAFSPNPEPDENNLNINKNKYNNKENEINEKALEDLKALGYKKTFVKESLMRNNFNYATTSYGLIVKYCYS